MPASSAHTSPLLQRAAGASHHKKMTWARPFPKDETECDCKDDGRYVFNWASTLHGLFIVQLLHRKRQLAATPRCSRVGLKKIDFVLPTPRSKMSKTRSASHSCPSRPPCAGVCRTLVLSLTACSSITFMIPICQD